MMHALPNLPNSEAFKAWRADASRWLPVALDIARGHGLPHADPHPFLTGTNLVVGLDGLALKIFPPSCGRNSFRNARRFRSFGGA
jgi:hygromycin-B 7''-O-kinase